MSNIYMDGHIVSCCEDGWLHDSIFIYLFVSMV